MQFLTRQGDSMSGRPARPDSDTARHGVQPRRTSLLLAAAAAGAMSVWGAAPAAVAANTPNNFTGSTAGSLLVPGNWADGLPDSGDDAVFVSGTGIRKLTAGDLAVGSFNVIATGGTFTIRNDTASDTDSTLTLGGGLSTGNSVSGTAADLLYVASGATFNLVGPNGSSGSGDLDLVLGQSGNFNAMGTMSITADIAGDGFGITKSGAGTLTLGGANTFTGALGINRGTLALTGSLDGAVALSFSGPGAFNRTSPGVGTVQSLGALTFGGGENTVQSTYGGSGDAGLNFASLNARGAGSTGNFFVWGGANGSTNKIAFTAAPTAGTLIDRGIFFNGDYAAYDAGGYLRAYDYSADANAVLAGAGATVGAVSADSNVRATAAITAQTSATINTLNLNGGFNFGVAAGATLDVNGILKSGGGSATITGGTGLRPATDAELIIRANDTLTINSPILANGTNALVKSGTATLGVGATNNLTGGLYLNAGTYLVTSDARLGAASAPIIFNGGTLNLSNGVTVGAARTITVNAAGGSLTAPNFTGSTVTIASTLQGTGQLTILGNPSGNNTIGTAVFSGDNSGFSGDLVMDRGTIQLNGAAAGGSGDIRFTAEFSNYTLKLRSDNNATFSNSSLMLPFYSSSAATINVDAESAGTDKMLTLNAVRLGANGGFVNVTGGNGYSLTITDLIMSGNGPSNTVRLNPTTASVNVGVAHITKSVLVLMGSGTHTIGQIVATSSDPGGLRVAGGEWTVNGANNYGSGSNGNVGASFGGSGTELLGGKLIVSQDDNLGGTPTSFKPLNINLNGGVLSASETFALSSNRGIGIGPRSGTAGGTGTIDVAAAKTLTYDGVLSSAANTGVNDLVKTGAGTLLLGGVNTYNGLTRIDGGALDVATGGKLGTGDVSVAAGATLTLHGDDATVDQIADTATLTLSDAGVLNLAFAGTESVGQLVLGTMAFNSPITFTAANGYSEGGAEFAGFFGSSTGSLTVIPEPGTASLLLLASGLLIRKRRPRDGHAA